MNQLPKVNFIRHFYKVLNKTPMEQLQPHFGRHPLGYTIGKPSPISVIYHPDLVQGFLGTENKKFSKENTVVRNLAYTIGDGVLTTYGAEWLEQKRKVQANYPKSFEEDQVQAIERIIDLYIDRLKSNRLRQWDHFSDTVLCCLLDINWQQIFGEPFPGDWLPACRVIKEGNTYLAAAGLGNIPVYRFVFKRMLGTYYQKLAAIIEPHVPADAGISTGEIVNLLIGGAVSTTGNLLFNITYWAQHPEAVERFQSDELYQRYFLMESLRMNPVVWGLWYKTLDDVSVNDIVLKKDELVVFNLYAMHRHPDFWENPEVFDPERFTKGNKNIIAYMPFGYGPRKCIGQNLALTTLSIFMKKLGKAFEFQLNTQQKVPAQYGSIIFPKIKATEFDYKNRTK